MDELSASAGSEGYGVCEDDMDEETKAIETTEDEFDDVTVDETDLSEEEAAPAQEEADQPEPAGEEAGTEETETAETRETDQFVLKHLDEVKTVSREEIIPLAQKGMDYDRIRQKLSDMTAEKTKADQSLAVLSELAKEAGFSDVNEFLDEAKAERLCKSDGIDIETARSRVDLERRKRELDEREARLAEEKAADGQDKADANERTRQAAEFAAEYPDVKPDEIPKEVWESVSKGETLLGAYRKYENLKLKAALAAKEKEAENKAKSAGSRRSDGQVTKQDEIDAIWNSED